MKRGRAIVIVIALVTILVFLMRGRHDASDEHYSGYAEGELVYVSSPLGGQLDELLVQRGDQIEKGKPLFVLERVEEAASRLEAEENMRESITTLDKARLDFDRAKSLSAKKVIAPESFDASQQALLGAEHAVAARKQALEQATWRYNQKAQAAGTTGLVYDTFHRPGEWIPAGTPVLALLPPEYMKVRFFVPEGDLGKTQIGTPLEVRMDGLEQPLPGKVSFVSPSAEYTLPIIYSRENRGKLVYLVEASLPPEASRQLHPGSPVEVHLTARQP